MKNTILSLCFTLILGSSVFADGHINEPRFSAPGHTNETKCFTPGHINEPRCLASGHINETKKELIVEAKDEAKAETNFISNIITQIYDLFNVAE